jgi:hypothetical protein
MAAVAEDGEIVRSFMAEADVGAVVDMESSYPRGCVADLAGVVSPLKGSFALAIPMVCQEVCGIVGWRPLENGGFHRWSNPRRVDAWYSDTRDVAHGSPRRRQVMHWLARMWHSVPHLGHG